MEKEHGPGLSFGELLRRYRLAAGLSQEALAERARLSCVGIGALERGIRRSPYRETVVLLAQALGLSSAAEAEFAAAAARPRQPRFRLTRGMHTVTPDRAPDDRPSPTDAHPNNLPWMKSFIGRDTEIAEICTLVEERRLVTIVGSGGVGKTHTSVQVGHHLLARFRNGVWLIKLGSLTSGDDIPAAVAASLALTLQRDGNPLQSLVRELTAAQALLIFDNCERVVEAVARAIGALGRGCQEVKILASSRQSLRVAGEAVYRMPSLDVPSTAAGVSAGDAMRYGAIALFCERSYAVDRRFVVAAQDWPTIAQICRRLDGIPLAIELVAARMRAFGLRELGDRINERFRVLVAQTADVISRAQTLQATLDWSFSLLDERERKLLQTVAIFVNGFSIAGATAVACDENLDERDVIDILTSLVEKSLVQTHIDGNTIRYYLLEANRDYALEKLWASGERVRLAESHLRYLCDLFTDLRHGEEWENRSSELDAALTVELADVRVALDGALRRSDLLRGSELLAAIGRNWAFAGLGREGVTRNEAFIEALPQSESQLLAVLSTTLASLLDQLGRKTAAFDAAARAVAHARASGNSMALAAALNIYALTALFVNETDVAEATLAEAEAIPDVSVALRRRFLGKRATVHARCGDLAEAARIQAQLYEEYRSQFEHAGGMTSRAIVIVHEILPAIRAGRDQRNIDSLLANFAGYLLALSDRTNASAGAREAIGRNATRGEPDSPSVAIAIEHLALVYALQGDIERAATLEGYADASLRRNCCERAFTERTTHERLLALLAQRMSREKLKRLIDAGTEISPVEVIPFVLGSS